MTSSQRSKPTGLVTLVIMIALLGVVCAWMTDVNVFARHKRRKNPSGRRQCCVDTCRDELTGQCVHLVGRDIERLLQSHIYYYLTLSCRAFESVQQELYKLYHTSGNIFDIVYSRSNEACKLQLVNLRTLFTK
jgi:hypothetical protein